MLPARTVLAVGTQAVVAGIFVLRGSSSPWREAEPWLPVYGTLIDVGCLVLLWRLTRAEGIGLSTSLASSEPVSLGTSGVSGTCRHCVPVHAVPHVAIQSDTTIRCSNKPAKAMPRL